MLNVIRFNRQRGIGLLELMLAIAIIAVLLIMATRYFQSAKRGENVTAMINVLDAVRTAVNSYAQATNGRFDGSSPADPGNKFNAQAAIATGSIPNSYISKDGEDIMTPYAKKLTFIPSTSSVTVVVTGIPEFACKQVAEKFKDSTQDSVAGDQVPNCTTAGGNLSILKLTFGGKAS